MAPVIFSISPGVAGAPSRWMMPAIPLMAWKRRVLGGARAGDLHAHDAGSQYFGCARAEAAVDASVFLPGLLVSRPLPDYPARRSASLQSGARRTGTTASQKGRYRAK